MKAEFDEYTRIGKGFLGMSSLWLGTDHLLYIKGSGLFVPFREEYRRFRYQDIQSIATVRTAGMWGYGALLLLGVVIFGLTTFAILAGRDPDSNFGLIWTLALPLPLGLICLIMLVRNFVLGPRCVCELQTALKKERIGPLSRIYKAKQVLDVLEGRIQEQQASVKLDAENSPPATVSGPLPQIVPETAMFGFIVSLVAGLLLVAAVHMENVVLVGALFTTILAAILLVMGGVITSVRKPCPEGVRGSLWVLLGTLFSVSGTALVYYSVVAFDDPSFTISAAGPFEAFASLPSTGNLAFYLIFVIAGGVMAIAGLIGLIIASRFKKHSTKNS